MSPFQKLISVVGERYAITNPADMTKYVTEWRALWPGKTPLVLRPGTTEEVSRILSIANAEGVKIVPQGGHTGLVGGGTPTTDNDEVVVSLERMNRIIKVDAADYSMTVEAGCVLAAVQEAAGAADRLFPLSLASEGTCQIGGNLASNAGGLNVLAYGNARDLCLGLEVILADGRVWNGLKTLRKDNTGYDLKNLMIGSEGTLGIITKATLKLFPKPQSYHTALVAVPHAEAALKLFTHVKTQALIAYELMSQFGIDLVAKHFDVTCPLGPSPWFVLLELIDIGADDLAQLLEEPLQNGLVTDAVIAQSAHQRAELWQLRENLSEAQKPEGGSIKHDVSVPVSHVPQFIEDATSALHQFMQDARLCCFGHLGDGNLHFNVSQPVGMDKQTYLDQWDAMNDVIFAVVKQHGGSISAEHGIGRLKREHMREIKSDVELDLMRQVKRMLDPNNILNPGRVLP